MKIVAFWLLEISISALGLKYKEMSIILFPSSVSHVRLKPDLLKSTSKGLFFSLGHECSIADWTEEAEQCSSMLPSPVSL